MIVNPIKKRGPKPKLTAKGAPLKRKFVRKQTLAANSARQTNKNKKIKAPIRVKRKYTRRVQPAIVTLEQEQDETVQSQSVSSEPGPPNSVAPKPFPAKSMSPKLVATANSSQVTEVLTSTRKRKRQPDPVDTGSTTSSSVIPQDIVDGAPDCLDSSSAGVDMKKIKRKQKRRRRNDNETQQQQQTEDSVSSKISEEQSTTNIYLENYNRVLQDRNKLLLEILEQRSAEIRNLKMRVSNMVKTSDLDKQDDEAENSEKNTNATDDTVWSMAELAKAYSLQKLSKPFYQYVQDRFALPLPPPNDVNKYIGDIHLTRGLLTQMVQILEYDGETMSDLDKVTVLQISQVPLNPIFEYDIDTDNIIGPHRSMTVVVARGLYSNWTQAVYLNFDTTTFKLSLNLVIEELHKIKFPVVACVCQYVDGKPNLWNELSVNAGCNYFSHPITTDFIYAFYYIDDLLLTMQRYFLKNGFTTTDNGQTITKDAIEKLLSHENTKVPINKDVINLNADTATIKNAIQLFSKQTANMIRFCLATDDSANACADFLDVISSFYMLMNSKKSYTTTSPHPTKLPYGKNLEFQNNVLNEIQLHFYKIRCPGRSKMSDFQRATMMSIESLKMLQHSTKQKYKVDSFATHNITSEYFLKEFNHIVAEQRNSDCNDSDMDIEMDTTPTAVTLLSPLKAFCIIKEIFLKPTKLKAEDYLTVTSETCFYENEIDPTRSEREYVEELIQWIADKYKDKHPNSVGQANEEFVRKMNKFEDMFQSIQNPQFKIAEGVVTKVFKKLKSHTFGMFLDVIHTFVMQRHLLRIKYQNAIGTDATKSEAQSSLNSTSVIKTEKVKNETSSNGKQTGVLPITVIAPSDIAQAAMATRKPVPIPMKMEMDV